MKWMKNNVVLPSNSTRVFTSKEGTRLHVDDARPVDTGTYRCVAENYVGQASESAMLRVIVPARITTIADRMTAIRDQEGFLPCTSEGIPSPTTRWYRNGEELAADDVELLPDGTLRIGTVETADKGDYTCIVSNEGGNDSRIIQLDVHCKYCISFFNYLINNFSFQLDPQLRCLLRLRKQSPIQTL